MDVSTQRGVYMEQGTRSRHGRLIASLLLAIAGCGGGSGSEQGSATPAPSPATASSVQAYMDALAAAGNFTGAVLVARGDTILLSKGYGWADVDQRIANTSRTKFRIGSNTKQFTAMAILLLEQQGKLRVSDSICTYVDACPAAWQTITVRHLLMHSSGIPDYTNLSDFPGLIGGPVGVTDLIGRFKQLPLEFVPGSQWHYSNSGYVLLGAIIEKTAGQPYASFLQAQIFTPLQMTHTGYDQSAITDTDHAQGYLTPTQKPVFINMSEFYAAGALYSTAEDMLLWDRAILTNRLVPATALEPMITAQIACPAGGCMLPSDTGYGYGWFIANEQRRRYVYHWGRIDGFTSSNGVFPAEQVSVILLSNLETSAVFHTGVPLGLLAIVASGP